MWDFTKRPRLRGVDSVNAAGFIEVPKLGTIGVMIETEDRESERKRRRLEASAAWRREQVEAARVLDEHIGVEPTRRRGSVWRVVVDRSQMTSDPMWESERDAGEESCLSIEEVEHIDDTHGFESAGGEKKRDIYTRTTSWLGIEAVERKLCAICDCEWPMQQIRKFQMREGQSRKWRNKLKPRKEIPEVLKKHYDESAWIPRMYCVMLSPAGVEKNEEGFGTGAMYVCRQCYRSMGTESETPPKFSIANGFDIGVLPVRLQSTTSIERRLTSMTSVWVPLTVLSGGKHMYIKGHVTMVTIDPVEIAVRLPQLIQEDSEKFLVFIAGSLTSAQTVRIMKKHGNRVGVVRELLDFYIKNNVLYQESGVTIDEEAIRRLAEDEMSGVLVQRHVMSACHVRSSFVSLRQTRSERNRRSTTHR